MTTPNIEELITYLRSFFIDENVSAIKANQIANALRSQAERIKVIERESEMRRIELHDVMLESDQLRAELAAIAATEPSMIYHGRCIIDCGDSGHQDVTMLKMIARETKLFTRPMPAQDVTELVEALEALIESTTGVDQVSVVNDARTALSKYKGAK